MNTSFVMKLWIAFNLPKTKARLIEIAGLNQNEKQFELILKKQTSSMVNAHSKQT